MLRDDPNNGCERDYVLEGRMGISRPLERARLANQIQGFRIPEKLEKKNRELLLPTEKIATRLCSGKGKKEMRDMERCTPK